MISHPIEARTRPAPASRVTTPAAEAPPRKARGAARKSRCDVLVGAGISPSWQFFGSTTSTTRSWPNRLPADRLLGIGEPPLGHDDLPVTAAVGQDPTALDGPGLGATPDFSAGHRLAVADSLGQRLA